MIIFESILKGGAIYTKRRLDREKQDQFKLNVSVVSKSYQLSADKALVIINVDDVNDNPPIIIYPLPDSKTNLQISNQVPIGYNVTAVKAVDSDIHENAMLTYRFMTMHVAHFKIDKYSGVITVTDDLSQISVRRVNIPVIVSDNGNSPLNASAGFMITINDSIAYVPAVSKVQDGNGSSGFFGGNLLILTIAMATAIIAVFFIVVFAVLCIAYGKGGRRRGKKYWLAAEEVTTTASLTERNGTKAKENIYVDGAGNNYSEHELQPQEMVSSMVS